MRGHEKAEGLLRRISKAVSEECVFTSVLPGEASLAQERSASAKHFSRTVLVSDEVRNVWVHVMVHGLDGTHQTLSNLKTQRTLKMQHA